MGQWDIKFWGVRGSSPISDPAFREVGGHTSCVSLHTPEGTFIFDAGTGLQPCGQWLAQQKEQTPLMILLSHAHLDHIIGLPYFQPLWQKETELTILSASLTPYGGTAQVLSRLLRPPYFPVPLEEMPAYILYKDMTPQDTLALTSTISLQAIPLNHPDGCTGYLIRDHQYSLAYISDHAHTDNETALATALNGVDVLIYDTTFTEADFQVRAHWGHSTWQAAIALAQQAQAKRLVLFHHDPTHTDEILFTHLHQARQLFPSTFLAQEGLSLHLSPNGFKQELIRYGN